MFIYSLFFRLKLSLEVKSVTRKRHYRVSAVHETTRSNFCSWKDNDAHTFLQVRERERKKNGTNG